MRPSISKKTLYTYCKICSQKDKQIFKVGDKIMDLKSGKLGYIAGLKYRNISDIKNWIYNYDIIVDNEIMMQTQKYIIRKETYDLLFHENEIERDMPICKFIDAII